MAGSEGSFFDIAVIGGGIAGTSVAAELAATHSVVLLEREDQPGYHTTGRSAALFSQTYGPPVIQALSRASAALFDRPPEGFAAGPLLSPRGVLTIARSDQVERLEAARQDPAMQGRLERLDTAQAAAMVPLLRPGYCAAALFETGAMDIDVHALHHGYLRLLRERGGQMWTGCSVSGLDRQGEGWLVETRRGTVKCSTVVNAGGAWADELGAMAGARPIGLVPKRRTALTVEVPAGIEISTWPLVVDMDEEFYVKPDAGRLLMSPADETPSPPCDAQPDEYDVALCVDRVEKALDLQIHRIESRWAGLRSFVADKTPVAGYDPDLPGFFWLAGQGGYGIQSAPALARTAARLVAGKDVPGDIAAHGVTKQALSPMREALAA